MRGIGCFLCFKTCVGGFKVVWGMMVIWGFFSRKEGMGDVSFSHEQRGSLKSLETAWSWHVHPGFNYMQKGEYDYGGAPS